MSPRNVGRRFPRYSLVIVFALLGLALIYLPGVFVHQYDTARRFGAVWGNVYLAVVAVGFSLLAGLTGWTVWGLWRTSRQKHQDRLQRARDPSQMTIAERQREVRDNLATVNELQNDPHVTPELRNELVPMIRWIEEKQDHKRLEIVAFGTISSGKSSLLNALAGRDVFATDLRGGTTIQRTEIPWAGHDEVRLVDTPGIGEVDGRSHEHMAANAAQDADLILAVVDGPLRDAEFRLLQQLSAMEKRIFVCLNKEDWYTPTDRDALLGQIRMQLQEHVAAADVIAVRSRETQRERIRRTSDGTEINEWVTVPPDIRPLADRMLATIQHDGQDLLAANLLLQSRGLVDEAKERVRWALDRRAWEIVDRYTWGAAGAAALSPLPVVDLAAGCVISTKMVLDIARVYRQNLDVDSAMRLLGEQGKNLLAVLGSATATPLVTASIASLIKTVPGVGTLAGGAMQGLIQALITRWIGSVFIRYFKEEMRDVPGGLVNLASQEWRRVTSLEELHKLVLAARRHWDGASVSTPLGTSEPAAGQNAR